MWRKQYFVLVKWNFKFYIYRNMYSSRLWCSLVLVLLYFGTLLTWYTWLTFAQLFVSLKKRDRVNVQHYSTCLCCYGCVCVMFRNQPAPLKTTFSLVWNWRQWTGRTLTWFVPPQWERSEDRKYSSCLTAGEAPSTIGAPSTPETSSLSAGVPWQNTAYSHLETSVSAALNYLFLVMHCVEMSKKMWIPDVFFKQLWS